MKRRNFRVVLTLFLVAAQLVLVTQVASAKLTVGVGDQSPVMFSDPRFKQIGAKVARLNFSWDDLRYPETKQKVDTWMKAARAAKIRPLVTFNQSFRPGKKRYMPTLQEFRTEFNKFRQLYPWVRDYQSWNEVNHCSQPTCNKAKRLAQIYDLIRRSCATCKVTAADLLDAPHGGDSKDMVAWVKNFMKYTKTKPKLWGLHNYIDANLSRTSGTRKLLKAVPGEIWFTETAGVLRTSRNSLLRFPGAKKDANGSVLRTPKQAATATRWIFKLARLAPKRITRIYFYGWQARSHEIWDSALIAPDGTPRPALSIIKEQIVGDS